MGSNTDGVADCIIDLNELAEYVWEGEPERVRAP